MQRQLPQGLAKFHALSEKLLAGLSEVSKSALPPGWHLEPFGAYVQGTCLPDSALDVALVASTEDEDQWNRVVEDGPGIVEKLATTLVQGTSDFFEAQPPAAAEGDAATGPLRLLVGDFSEGRRQVKHELALHLGDASTGRFDALLRRLLNTDPRAQIFVMLVKHWARSRRLADPAAGGSFFWTLLAVFVLQHEGLLPPLRDFCAAGGATQSPPAGSGGEGSDSAAPAAAAPPPEANRMNNPGAMLLRFADIMLGHVERPAPRPRICLWTGSFVSTDSEQAGTAAAAFAAALAPAPAAGGDGDAGDLAAVAAKAAPAGGALIVQELRRLQAIFRACSPASGSGGDGGAAAAAARPSPSSSPTSGPAGFSTPTHARRRGARPLAPVREAANLKEAGSQRALATIPEFPLARIGGQHPGQRSESPARAVTWRIDKNWIASYCRGGAVAEMLQLDPELAGPLSRAGWERRFARRLHQIRIGKATKEYRRWHEHFQRHGRRPGDPATPRALAQTSKKQFENAYSEWRTHLHRFDASPSSRGRPSSRSLTSQAS